MSAGGGPGLAGHKNGRATPRCLASQCFPTSPQRKAPPTLAATRLSCSLCLATSPAPLTSQQGKIAFTFRTPPTRPKKMVGFLLVPLENYSLCIPKNQTLLDQTRPLQKLSAAARGPPASAGSPCRRRPGDAADDESRRPKQLVCGWTTSRTG